MYDRFSRAVDTRVNEVRGSGLGLSIVKEITDLMGGEIYVESKIGEGTTFKVCFDVAYVDKEESKKEDKPSVPPEYLSGIHLLIAEDNDLNYEVEQDLLDMYEITCERAENGIDCIKKFKKAKAGTFDAILMDMQMPIMDGIEATKHIRELNAEGAKIPIVAVTANAFTDDVRRCIEAGMNSHLPKPFDITELINTLAPLLDKHSIC